LAAVLAAPDVRRQRSGDLTLECEPGEESLDQSDIHLTADRRRSRHDGGEWAVPQHDAVSGPRWRITKLAACRVTGILLPAGPAPSTDLPSNR